MKECFGKCNRCVWMYNRGCSEWGVNRLKSIRIKMLCTVRPDRFAGFQLGEPGTILRVSEEYDAVANKNGAITAICSNGEKLGVKPAEFEFLRLPKWLYDIWAPVWPYSVENAVVVDNKEEEKPI